MKNYVLHYDLNEEVNVSKMESIKNSIKAGLKLICKKIGTFRKISCDCADRYSVNA